MFNNAPTMMHVSTMVHVSNMVHVFTPSLGFSVCRELVTGEVPQRGRLRTVRYVPYLAN